MSPQRLYDFLVRTWLPLRNYEEQQADSRAAAQNLRGLEAMRAKSMRDLEQLKTARKAVTENLAAAQLKNAELRDALAIVGQDIRYYQSRLVPRDYPASLDEDDRLEYEETRLAIQNEVKKKLAKADLTMARLQARESSITRNSIRAEAENKKIDDRQAERETELADIERQIWKVRRQSVEAASRQARAAVG